MSTNHVRTHIHPSISHSISMRYRWGASRAERPEVRDGSHPAHGSRYELMSSSLAVESHVSPLQATDGQWRQRPFTLPSHAVWACALRTSVRIFFLLGSCSSSRLGSSVDQFPRAIVRWLPMYYHASTIRCRGSEARSWTSIVHKQLEIVYRSATSSSGQLDCSIVTTTKASRSMPR